MAKRSSNSSKPSDHPSPHSPAQAPASSHAPVAESHAQIVEPPTHPWLTHTLLFSNVRPVRSALAQEWLLTNGSGAYAMGTAAGINTRRYHGLFVASTRPPVGRIIALHQVLDHLILSPAPGSGSTASQTLDLSSNLFRNDQQQVLFAPQGLQLLRSFQKGLFTRWLYSWGQVRVMRELYLHWNDQAATLRYLIDWPGAQDATLTLRVSPMLSLRDFHGVSRSSPAGTFRTDIRADRVVVHRAPHAVTLTCSQQERFARWIPSPDLWWYNLFYPADEERGQECFEDCYVPGAFEIPLGPAQASPLPAGDPEHHAGAMPNPDQPSATCREVLFSIALGDHPADPQGWMIDERAERLKPVIQGLSLKRIDLAPPSAAASLRDPMLFHTLVQAADDFLVSRLHQGRQYTTLMAGYPWFADWGRDTFIALPGLMLATGRFSEARSCLQLYAQAIKDGLVPNRFDDYDNTAAHYNTVDASLWFLRSSIAYVHTSGDRDTWHDWLAPVCLQIMESYIRGTQFGIRVGGDGLVTAGNHTTQLTWMDAATNGVVFTPRPGKAVEINALWYYALTSLATLIHLSPEIDHRVADHYLKLADRIKRSFIKVFWNEQLGCLYDHVWTDDQNKDVPDATIRPNQIFAVSLPVSPLPKTKQAQILDVVQQHLLTPAGLRTLPTTDPKYHGKYTGPQFQRDQAYHQGTIWPWLMGPYCEAILRLHDFSSDSRRQVLGLISPLVDQLLGPGLGQLHEIYESDPGSEGRHRPVGCPAQAWSISEMLRCLRLVDVASPADSQ